MGSAFRAIDGLQRVKGVIWGFDVSEGSCPPHFMINMRIRVQSIGPGGEE